MNELSLFTGAGGGVLGSLLLGHRMKGYVEIDEYCQRIIAQRITDGILPEAPIFGDIRAFISEGYARAYQGMVDVVSGGFPCQPHSLAGKKLGAADDRNLWPETIEVIRQVRPRYAFLENVAALVRSPYFDQIQGDLAESGYDCRWRLLSAAEVGAPHRRDRLWIVAAHTDSQHDFGRPQSQQSGSEGEGSWHQSSGSSTQVVDAIDQGFEVGRPNSNESLQEGEGGGNADTHQLPAASQSSSLRGFGGDWTSAAWWQTEPNVDRMVNGLAYGVDRLRSIGNGQVPLCAATAWKLLTGKFDDE